MQIVLIGNYKKDRQQSMHRFAEMLNSGFLEAGVSSKIIKPFVLFGLPFKNTNNGFGKWMGYLDKWILFPLILKITVFIPKYSKSHFHICDHSNAPYIAYLPKSRTVITCHDVIAIRESMGYKGTYVNVSKMGKILQKKILSNLAKAEFIACVSTLTLTQLKELVVEKEINLKKWIVIHNALNPAYFVESPDAALSVLNVLGLSQNIPFLLHVGSGLSRKNRPLLPEMVKSLNGKWNGYICFAGKVIEPSLLEHAKKLNLSDRIVSVSNVGDETLRALYSTCAAFIFPSFSEGFGWPLIEAQACGAPVITSNIEPMMEVTGDAALYCDPKNPSEFANAFLLLENEIFRKKIIQNGLDNCKRFSKTKFIESYLKLHNLNKN